MNRTLQINNRLTEAFLPQHLEVIDESESHRGHSGFQEGGESHFRVVISSETLKDLSRVARHRAIHKAIGEQLMGEIHALAIDIQL